MILQYWASDMIDKWRLIIMISKIIPENEVVH
jgi:hypothetical protein